MSKHLSTQHDGGSSTSISKDLEKVNVYEHNKYAGMGLTHEETDFYENFPEDQRKAMIRKVDLRLVPVLAVLYLFSHIDRANIGNAIGFAAFTLLSTVVLELSYMRLNKKRDALDEADIREQYSEEDLQKMGDKSPLFKYKL